MCTYPILLELGSLVSPSALSWLHVLQPEILCMVIGERPYLYHFNSCRWMLSCLVYVEELALLVWPKGTAILPDDGD
jgi:hypothetical protein